MHTSATVIPAGGKKTKTITILICLTVIPPCTAQVYYTAENKIEWEWAINLSLEEYKDLPVRDQVFAFAMKSAFSPPGVWPGISEYAEFLLAYEDELINPVLYWIDKILVFEALSDPVNPAYNCRMLLSLFSLLNWFYTENN